MGRRLRTPVPQHPSLLSPELPDRATVAEKEGERKIKDTRVFNKRHRVRNLRQLTPQPVWITDTKTQGTVVSTHSTPRSYVVDSPSGTIRRNRHHLVPMPETVPQSQTPCTPTQPVESVSNTPSHLESPNQTQKTLTPVPTRTRFGRVVVKTYETGLVRKEMLDKWVKWENVLF